MANPWNVARPYEVSPGDWETAESFANSVYLDVAGDWIPQFFTGGGTIALIREVVSQRWAQMTDPKERWLYALQGRLETLQDRDTAERIVKGLASILLPGVLGSLIPDFGGDVGGAENVGDVLDGIAAVSNSAQASLLDSGNRVLDVIGNLLQSANGNINTTTNSALSALTDTGRRATDIVSSLSQLILRQLGDNTDSAFGLLQDVIANNGRSLDGLMQQSTGILGILTERAQQAIERVLEEALGHNSAVIDVLGEILGRHIDTATANSTAITRAISRQIDAEVEQAQRNAEVITRGLGNALEDITGVANSALSTVGAAITREGGASAAATAQAADEIKGELRAGLGGLGKFLSRLTGEGDDRGVQGTRDRIDKAYSAVMGQGNCPPDFVEFVHNFVDKLTADWDPGTPLVHILAEVQMWQSIFGGAFAVLGNCVAQTAARAAPTALNSAPELQDQMRRGLVQKPEAMFDLLSQGFTPERADRLLAARRTFPDVGVIQTWYLRGMINPKTAFDYLAKLGFDPDDSQGLLEMAYFIPPPADLVTMAVREAFSPAVAKRFGQYEDFPEDFAKYAAQQGISEVWAQRYWAAHWSLPSPQQGFEMLQRDVISRDDLNMLLKALDVMPFWRDKLTQIAFRPVTRVDIRRMHALKLLDHAGMVKRYRHMGYSPDDAEFMAQFTERLNAPKGEKDVEELEGATKATVLQLFRRGIISEADARKILDEMGTGDRAMNVLLTNERTKLELEHRDQETDLILEQAGAGVIDTDTASDRLGAIGLTSIELSRARAKLAKIEARQTKLPTRMEAEKMLRANVLNELEYAAVLRKLGYSVFWTAKFVELAHKTKE